MPAQYRVAAFSASAGMVWSAKDCVFWVKALIKNGACFCQPIKTVSMKISLGYVLRYAAIFCLDSALELGTLRDRKSFTTFRLISDERSLEN